LVPNVTLESEPALESFQALSFWGALTF